jgi:uncharacterized protein YbaR (Trm112 family)
LYGPIDPVADATKLESTRQFMIRPELLKMLVCPENKSELAAASSELVGRINRAIAAGQLTNKAGNKVERPLDGGLVRADGAVLYPIVDGIPMMLVDEAIPLAQPAVEG